jgi:uncharacterized membrane protein YuzA (DUF378 family)
MRPFPRIDKSSKGERQMKALHTITALLVLIGGLNWGLVGLAGFDLVAAVLGEATLLSRTVYALVGISAVFQATQLTIPLGQAAAARS